MGPHRNTVVCGDWKSALMTLEGSSCSKQAHEVAQCMLQDMAAPSSGECLCTTQHLDPGTRDFGRAWQSKESTGGAVSQPNVNCYPNHKTIGTLVERIDAVTNGKYVYSCPVVELT